MIGWLSTQLQRQKLSRALYGSVAMAVAAFPLRADLPAGYGMDTMVRICGKCHSPERAASMHQTRGAWEDTVAKMLKLGAQGSDEELDEVLTYLTAHYGPEKPPPVNLNKASMVDLQTTLLLRRSQALAVINYRKENGEFKSFDDLKKVPGLDISKLETKKSRIIF